MRAAQQRKTYDKVLETFEETNSVLVSVRSACLQAAGTQWRTGSRTLGQGVQGMSGEMG